ncbi:MAG: hypothetical protein Q7R45_08370 [Sulfuricaulis sp.]|nr:hypothetical protein [Sulfuricaulis sp.]
MNTDLIMPIAWLLSGWVGGVVLFLNYRATHWSWNYCPSPMAILLIILTGVPGPIVFTVALIILLTDYIANHEWPGVRYVKEWFVTPICDQR